MTIYLAGDHFITMASHTGEPLAWHVDIDGVPRGVSVAHLSVCEGPDHPCRDLPAAGAPAPTPARWPDDYVHIIECDAACTTVTRTFDDVVAWQDAMSAHVRHHGHQPRAYSRARPHRKVAS